MTESFEETFKSMGIETIDQLVEAAYGVHSNDILSVMKLDAPLLTNTAGTFNDIYGAEVWNQLNEGVTAWKILGTKVYQRAGFRIKIARGVVLGGSGIAETGNLPDTVKPTYDELTLTLKLIVDMYSGSLLKELRAKAGNDDLSLDQVRADIGEEHVKGINKMILEDVDTLAGDNLESIDRVCASQAEAAAMLSAATDANIYGFDRSASTLFDAYVDYSSAGDRVLTPDMIRDAVRTIQRNSNEQPNVILTGYDTQSVIDRLFDTQARYTNERIAVSVAGGIQTGAGTDTMLIASKVMGIPIVVDDLVVTDTISRIYFLNTKYIWKEIAMPTKNLETSDYILLNKAETRGGFITAGELKCVKASAQGKIRDLK